MDDIKYCFRCNVQISDVNIADWYSHMSIKYCDDCRVIVKKEQTAARVARLRERKKQKEKEQLEYIKLLERENESLKKLVLVTGL